MEDHGRGVRGLPQKDRHLGEVVPTFIAPGLGLGMLCNVVVPRRGELGGDGCACLVVPDPTRYGLDVLDDAVGLAELEIQ